MRRVIAVGAVIVDHGRVLLGKHVPERKGFWAGKWICPGGGLELGESLRDGVAREVKEETGLDIEVGDFVTTFDRSCPYHDEDAHVIYIDFFGKVKGGELRASSDLGTAEWIDVSRLREIKDEIHEDTQALLIRAGLM